MSIERYLSDPALREFVLAEGDGALALVRRGYEEGAGLLGLSAIAGRAVCRVPGGRESHPVVELPGGERAVVRGYRRGGLMRHVNRERYFIGHRAFDELRATERAAGAGVRVPTLLAAVERRAVIGYTASLASRWIDAGEELAGWLKGKPSATVEPVLAEAGRQIARMHDAGVSHPDLNLRNLLIAAGAARPAVYILDFDRARVLPGPVSRPARARALRRLARSARKLDASIDGRGWAALRDGYGAAWPLDQDLG